MKKRLIWFAVIVLLLSCSLVLLTIPATQGIYSWLKNNLYGLYVTFLDGPRKFAFIAILFSIIIALLSFVLLKVPAVNDFTMPPLNVTQKPVIDNSIVVIEENKGDN